MQRRNIEICRTLFQFLLLVVGVGQQVSSCAKVKSLAVTDKNLLAIVSGNGQSLETDGLTSSPLKVILSKDGSPVEGETVTYQITSGSSVELVESTSVTDANGQASVKCRRVGSSGDSVISASWKTQTVLFQISAKASTTSGEVSDSFIGIGGVKVASDGSVILSWAGSDSDDVAGAKIALYVSTVSNPDSLAAASGTTPVQITGFAHRAATLFDMSTTDSLPEKVGELRQAFAPSASVYTIPFSLVSSQSYLIQLKYQKKDKTLDGNRRVFLLRAAQLPSFAGASSATVLGVDSIRVNWTIPTGSGVAGFKVYRNGVLTQSVGPTVSSLTDVGLIEGTTYTYRVRVFNELAEEDTNTVDQSATTLDVTAPVFGGATLATSLSSSAIRVEWSAATGTPSAYKVYRSTSAPFTPDANNLVATIASTATTWSDSSLGDEMTYYYIVRAQDASGNSDTNVVIKSATTSDAGAPVVNGIASASINAQGLIAIGWNWTHTMGQVSSWRVYVSTSTPVPTVTPSTTAAGAATSTTFGPLAENTTYYIRVHAVDSHGVEDANSTQLSVATSDLQAPQSFAGINTATCLTETTARVTWLNNDADVATYRTYAHGGGYTTSFCSGAGISCSCTSTQCDISGLTARTQYRWVVRGADTFGNEEQNTNSATCTTPDTTAPSFAGITSISPSGSTVALNWTISPTADAAIYRVYSYVCPDANTCSGTFTLNSTVNGRTTATTTVSGLLDNRRYYFKVLACDDYTTPNCDSNNVVRDFATGDAVAPTFSGIDSVTPLTETTMRVRWYGGSDSGGVNRYTVYAFGSYVTPLSTVMAVGSEPTDASGDNDGTCEATELCEAVLGGLTPYTLYDFVVRAKDVAGNEDANVVHLSDRTLDTTAPTFSELQSATYNAGVDLAWTAATDAGSGILRYRIFWYACADSNPCTPTFVYGTPDLTKTPAQSACDSDSSCTFKVTGLPDGRRYYFAVRAEDVVGNIDLGVTSQTYSLTDVTAPTGSVVFSVGSSTHPNLTLSASDSGGVASMYITNTAGCASGGAWETYATTKANWNLGAPSSSQYNVYVKFKDNSGNESSCVTDSMYVPALSYASATGLTGWSGDGSVGTPYTTSISEGGTGSITLTKNAAGTKTAAAISCTEAKTWITVNSGASTVDFAPNYTDSEASYVFSCKTTYVGLETASIYFSVTVQNVVRYTKIVGSSSSHYDWSGYNCALQETGNLYCWGYNGYGILGLASPQEASSPTLVSGVSGVTDVAAGPWHTCAVVSTGAVKCWGLNGSGELGNGTSVNSPTPVTVSSINGTTSSATKVATGFVFGTGNSFSCAILTTGAVKCWGSNSSGQLGNGTYSSSFTPVSVSGIDGTTSSATALCAGQAFTCAIVTTGATTGAVMCWGLGTTGQLGNSASLTQTTPVSVTGIDGSSASARATSLSCESNHSCAALANGEVRCWGYNTQYQLGDLTTSARSTPVTVSGIDGISAQATQVFTAGGSNGSYSFSSCALMTGGTVRCWGRNDSGQTGSTPIGNVIAPTPVSSINGTSVVATAIGGATMAPCAIIHNGSGVHCWGRNDYGELGIGVRNSELQPKTVTNIDGTAGKQAIQISRGTVHACAVMSTGTVYCWGDNTHGQLGNLSTTTSYVPVQVNGISTAVQVVAGNSSTCVRLSSGEVKCWGHNAGGKLGLGHSTTPVITPTTVFGITGNAGDSSTRATDISISYSQGCAVLANQAIKCWGDDSWGQLGNGATGSTTSPGTVTGIDGTTKRGVKVSVGPYKVCAVLDNNNVNCWGYSWLGDGLSNSSVQNPVTVVDSGSSAISATDITVGHSHACALNSSNGTVMCWGRNSNRQLSDGTVNDRTYAVPAINLGNTVIAVSAGTAATCFVLTDNSMKCVGSNDYNQLATRSSTTAGPIAVVNGTTEGSIYNVSVMAMYTNSEANGANGGSCGLFASGEVRCWGAGSFLGNGYDPTNRFRTLTFP
jgi:alpha-tubulin suppressor-like RCC1 family protein